MTGVINGVGSTHQMRIGRTGPLSYGVAMKKDGLAVEGEGDLVQGRPVN